VAFASLLPGVLVGCYDYDTHYISVASPQNLDATGERNAFVGSVYVPGGGTKNIRQISCLHTTTVKAGGSVIRYSLQDLDTSAIGPFPDGTQDQFVDIANAALPTTLSWVTSGNLSADRSVVSGDVFAFVVEFDGAGRLGSDVIRTPVCNFLNTSLSQRHMPSVAIYNGTSWSANVSIPNIVFHFSDGTLGTFQGSQIFSAVNTHAFHSGTAIADEYAARFSFPCGVKLSGCNLRVTAASINADFEVVLYDSASTVLYSRVIDGAWLKNAQYNLQLQWGEITVAANSVIRLSVKPTQATNNITINSYDLPSTAYMPLTPGGSEVYSSTRLDSGSWTDNTTRKLAGFGLLVSAVDIGGSGGVPLIGPGGLVY
jgi:hypothetical protein